LPRHSLIFQVGADGGCSRERAVVVVVIIIIIVVVSFGQLIISLSLPCGEQKTQNPPSEALGNHR